MDLFSHKNEKLNSPLADRMRPETLKDFVGQEELVGEGKILKKLIEKDEVPSMIFWGPPGSGKTTLAGIIAGLTKSNFVQFSAVESGVKEFRRIIEEAKEQQKFYRKRTILFVDEIHRWNKAQQDAFLPYVEKGVITLIGATTENPSFEVISPLLSRSRVFVLKQLRPRHIKIIIEKALNDKERGLGEQGIELESKALDSLIDGSGGDGRIALNALQIAAEIAETDSNSKKGIKLIDYKIVEQAFQHKALMYDKKGEEHYNVISAFIKSLRGSDADAALYWLARMVEAGEDPRFIARRLVVLSSEDIGNADPRALMVATAAAEAVEFVGMPEAQINLAQAVVYLAKAPKSNASYAALLRAKKDVKTTLNLPVPLHLRNAPTGLMKNLGYGRGYRYVHTDPEGSAEQLYLPKELKGRRYLE